MKVFKNKLNENKNYLTKNKEYGQLTAFPLSNMLTQDNLEKSAPKGVVTALLTFFFFLLHPWMKLFTLMTSFCSRMISAFQFLISILVSKTASLLSHNSCITCKSYISVLLTFPLPWLFFSVPFFPLLVLIT